MNLLFHLSLLSVTDIYYPQNCSILLLSILPQKVELLINRKSILSDYMSEASLLDELQDEVISVDSSLKDKTLLKSRILDLIPIKQQAEKVLPIILTNLINSSSLRLVEILPSNETSYLSNSDDELFADIVDFDDSENFLTRRNFFLRMILNLTMLERPVLIMKMTL